jgi:hypothetical protein
MMSRAIGRHVMGTGSVEHWTHPKSRNAPRHILTFRPADGNNAGHLGIGERVFLTMRNLD